MVYQGEIRIVYISFIRNLKRDITDAAVINIWRYYWPDINAFWNLYEMDNSIIKINWGGNIKPEVDNH